VDDAMRSSGFGVLANVEVPVFTEREAADHCAGCVGEHGDHVSDFVGGAVEFFTLRPNGAIMSVNPGFGHLIVAID